MTFQLSQRSFVNLHGVHPDLCKVVVRALELTALDFGIIEGLRSEEKEEDNVSKGLSETMDSRHLFGMAVDFMAFEDGKGTWAGSAYHTVAEAFRQAAVELCISIRWGGCWDRTLNGEASADAATAGYVARRHAAGAQPFLDLDHIELDRKAYPDPVTS